jgi:replication factor C small subunit
MKELIWYEKYRPGKIDQLILPQSHNRAFQKFIEQEEIPHLLFHGPAGGGKTTLSQILISNCAGRSLILNASSEDRGITTIKVRVTQFASSQRINQKLNIVFFDEANGLTPDAQEALKNTIEKYHRNCRFIFTTNEFDKITEPIASRCQMFKFDSFPKKNLRLYLAGILKQEEVEYDRKDLREIMNRYYPDIRTIINTMQSCSISGTLNLEDVLYITDYDLLASHINEGHILAIRNMLAGSKDFLGVYRFLFNDYIPNEMENKTDAAIAVAEYLWRDRSVVDKEINMTACLLELMSLNNIEADFSTAF